MKQLIVLGGLLLSGCVWAQTGVNLQPDATAGMDATLIYYTYYNYQNLNFGNFTSFSASCSPGPQGGPYKTRGIIKFDLSVVPTNAIVLQSSMYLYGTGYFNANLPGHGGNNAATIKRVTGIWMENATKWNNQPGTSPVDSVLLAPSTSTDQDYIVDVTAMTQYQVTNPTYNFGFLLKLVTEDQLSPDGCLSGQAITQIQQSTPC